MRRHIAGVTQPAKVVVDLSHRGKPFKHFFNAVGYANVDYTYTKPTLKMYDHLSSFNKHFKYMRMHNILTAHGKGDYYFLSHGMDYGNPPGQFKYSEGGDSVVSLDENGNLSFDWTTVDRVYDVLVDHDIRPIVETVFMPSCIQKSPEEWFIPADFNMWKTVLQEFVSHLQERYGKEEVEEWYFEIWNEPDNQRAWVDDPRTFLALYDYMEDAIHSVNPALKVGGPAVKQSEDAVKIFRAFLEHCTEGLNYATGKFGTRVDFISVHCKGGRPGPDCYNPSTEVMFDALKIYMDILKEYPQYDGIEFVNDESDIVWAGNQGIWKESWMNFRNTHYFPGFVCKMVNTYCHVVEDQYGMNLSIVDSDNCHLQWERFLFSGNRSQFTPLMEYPSTDLLKKPSFNGYVLLSHLGDKRFIPQCNEGDFGRKFGVLPTTEGDALSIMVWNFEDGMEDEVNHRKIKLDIANIPWKDQYRLIHYRIDPKHSSSYNLWREMGKPDLPSIEEIKTIREGEGLELYSPVNDIELDGDLTLELDMPMHSVSLLLLVPVNEEKPKAPKWIKGCWEKGYHGNFQAFLKWEHNKEKDFLYYKVWRRKEDQKDFELISANPSINTAVYTDMGIEEEGRYFYKVQAVNASYSESECSSEWEVLIKNKMA